MKPAQADEIFENAKPPFSLREVADILPFIGSVLKNKLAFKAVEQGNYKDLGEIAPFLDRNIINNIARNFIAEGICIAEIAPFVSREIIGELALKSYDKDGLS